ncbi:uncharacterized protein CANTADRAFT_7623 [Suhomyces tanzawaensis NRRL Y-17324]|uniref:SPIN90/Ldb17 leucine-rich domain-containing protein n=1 Tax=Suhomyces tanzawaensis NRRL Y-17324 TaxID=984487 RepID=A0A1E4SFJ9_9ASCO|nr:uncharacterized protein CANTADRAFT_7623 [Suhomyces tanzawaensis NRRL Y-17324]ODV78172.1 hypothetical protein CANTADRAFT_7623 [Suhomyces tanzawaensis NRRL Y-17324]
MYEIPKTSFPGVQQPQPEPRGDLDDQLTSMLINSDSSECNENLSIYIKFIIDNVYNNDIIDNQRTYHSVSLYALKLVTLNMFVKNYRFCIGKILAFLSTFSIVPDDENASTVPDLEQCNIRVAYEKECLKEFLCITLLLLLKVENEDGNTKSIDIAEMFQTLRDYDFITVISNFITSNVINIHNNPGNSESSSPYILLKFSCDILFEYLYHTELLSDKEFDDLTNNTKLIPTLIKYLLSNEMFNQYDLDGDNLEDEDKLTAYEQFKLLLFINEQYLMKSYSCSVRNKVFEGLMGSKASKRASTQDATKITGFINLLIYHLNREESRIIKILILKFLYMVFTTSYTSKLIYMNDLRILIEIFIRDMNDLDYTEEIENVILILTYLKVLYPLLRFSQLNEVGFDFKKRELMDLLGHLVINSEVDQDSTSISENQREQRLTISKMAMKCMSIDWLQVRPHNRKDSSPPTPQDESFGELTHIDSTTSIESLDISLTRVASVRTSNRSDFYHHTTTTNGRKPTTNQFMDNNNNVFMSESLQALTINDDNQQESPWTQITDTNMLDLSSEFLKSKPLPKVPVPSRQSNQFYKNNDSSSSSVNSSSLLVRKALKKKAPPPPPSPKSHFPKGQTPPPPPPPRRRKF